MKHLTHLLALTALLLISGSGLFAAEHKTHGDRTELRIKDMRAKFKITTAQEPQWAKVEHAMLDDAKIMDNLTQARIDQAKTMNAIDDLKSYAEIADAHANGIKNQIPLFTDLYASMSDEQKKSADILFRHGYYHQHRHHHKSDKK